LLVLIGAVADLAEAMDEDRADSIGRRNTNQKECCDGGATAVGSSASGQVVVARATGGGAA
jgi:hypothetical protein